MLFLLGQGSGLGSTPINWSAFMLHLYSRWEYIRCIMKEMLKYVQATICLTTVCLTCNLVYPWGFFWMLFSSLHVMQHLPMSNHIFPFLYSPSHTLLCSVLLWACAAALQTLLKSLSGSALPLFANPSVPVASSSSPFSFLLDIPLAFTILYCHSFKNFLLFLSSCIGCYKHRSIMILIVSMWLAFTWYHLLVSFAEKTSLHLSLWELVFDPVGDTVAYALPLLILMQVNL